MLLLSSKKRFKPRYVDLGLFPTFTLLIINFLN